MQARVSEARRRSAASFSFCGKAESMFTEGCLLCLEGGGVEREEEAGVSVKAMQSPNCPKLLEIEEGKVLNPPTLPQSAKMAKRKKKKKKNLRGEILI